MNKRYLFPIVAAFALSTMTAAYAQPFQQQQQPDTVTLPVSDVVHALNLLRNGGTRFESDDLATKIAADAQANMNAARAAQNKAPPPPAAPPAETNEPPKAN